MVVRTVARVATCGYSRTMQVATRELTDNLSRYMGWGGAGESVLVTVHGRVVAELVPSTHNSRSRASTFESLIASGVITPPVEAGDPLEDWPEIRLPSGAAAALIDSGRDEP